MDDESTDQDIRRSVRAVAGAKFPDYTLDKKATDVLEKTMVAMNKKVVLAVKEYRKQIPRGKKMSVEDVAEALKGTMSQKDFKDALAYGMLDVEMFHNGELKWTPPPPEEKEEAEVPLFSNAFKSVALNYYNVDSVEVKVQKVCGRGLLALAKLVSDNAVRMSKHVEPVHIMNTINVIFTPTLVQMAHSEALKWLTLYEMGELRCNLGKVFGEWQARIPETAPKELAGRPMGRTPKKMAPIEKKREAPIVQERNLATANFQSPYPVEPSATITGNKQLLLERVSRLSPSEIFGNGIAATLGILNAEAPQEVYAKFCKLMMNASVHLLANLEERDMRNLTVAALGENILQTFRGTRLGARMDVVGQRALAMEKM